MWHNQRWWYICLRCNNHPFFFHCFGNHPSGWHMHTWRWWPIRHWMIGRRSSTCPSTKQIILWTIGYSWCTPELSRRRWWMMNAATVVYFALNKLDICKIFPSSQIQCLPAVGIGGNWEPSTVDLAIPCGGGAWNVEESGGSDDPSPIIIDITLIINAIGFIGCWLSA